MAIRTYSIDDQTAEEFKEQTPDRKTSEILQNLMEEYLGDQKHQDLEHETLFENVKLTQKQNALLDFLITKDFKQGKKLAAIFQECKNEGIYSRKHHFKEAIKNLSNNDRIPYDVEGSKLTKLKVNCICGASWPISGLQKSAGVCTQCDRKIVDLSKKNKQQITVS